MKRMGYIIAALLIGAAFFLLSAKAQAESSRIEEWREYIEVVAEQYGICPELVEAVIERESSWDPAAVNGACVGLMQIDPVYHEERMDRLGVTDITDPYQNILVGVDFLEELFVRYEDVYAVLMYYNAGYSDKYGLGAWEDGRYSDYAVEVSERAAELEREHGK